MDTTQTYQIQTQDVREYRRFLAWKLFCQGYRQKEIAQALEVTKGAVSQWIKRAKTEGPQSLQARKAEGPKARLTQEQLARLPALLEPGAEVYGFRGNVWTRKRVAFVIRKEFGVSYSLAHISKLLRRIGWTQQKPRRRATQRNLEAIAHWKQERLPGLKKGRKRRVTRSCM